MSNRRNWRWLAPLAGLALFAASCGGDDDGAAPASTTQPAETVPAVDDEPVVDDEPMVDDEPVVDEAPVVDDEPMPAMSMPGEGTTITMARADWSTGYFQAQVHKQLLEELGYTVTEPSERELGPSLAYLAMAQGDVHFWANSWYPAHYSWHAADMPDGSTVGDHVEIVGQQMLGGGPQGFLITKSVADEYGITHIDQINDDPEITALFDIDDDGKAEIYGCTESWTCDDIINSQIAFSGWDNVEQVKAGYDAMFAEATAKIEAGEPAAVYTWAPSAYITILRPGDNVYWLAVEEVIDDSNPTGVEGGEGHDQRPGQAPFTPDQCPAAADAGTCQLGWVAADILVTANKEFAEANPAARALWEAIVLSPIDVSLAVVEQDGGMDTEVEIAQLAAGWIADNRDLVDGWLAAARAAG